MKDNILKGASILTAMLMFSMLLSPVLAAPPQPNNRWGYAYDGAALPDGELITGWIDGVQYGDDLTVDGTGLFSVDTLGDEDYGLGIEKDGGVIGDLIYYVHGDLTSANGGVFMTGVSVPEDWEVGGFETFNENLNDDPASPPLLKINAISSDSGYPPATDYVVIYNPTGAPVDVTAFSLAVGTAASIAIGAGDLCGDSVLKNPIPPSDWAAIDMATWGGISTTGNSIKLIETTSGYIIDRVEYGAIATEPENTNMANANNPLAGQEIFRTVPGGDTNDCFVDFTIAPSEDHNAVSPVTYGPAAPTNMRTNLPGGQNQDTGTDVLITWTDNPLATGGYNIYRGPAQSAIDFVTPLNAGPIAPGVEMYTDVGAIAGSSEYYYVAKGVSATLVEGESSAMVGKYTRSFGAGYNAFGSPLEVYPDLYSCTPYAHSYCNWLLVDTSSVGWIPSSSAIYTYNFALQGWQGRIDAVPDAAPHNTINSLEDAVMVYMTAANDYTFFGWPAEQTRTANFVGKPVLPAPANFDIGGVGNDMVLTWDPVVGADHYEVFSASGRNLENFDFAAPVYSGPLNTWTDVGAAAALGETYYIVAAADAVDLGDSTNALGKYTRNFGVGYNAFSNPFAPFSAASCTPYGHNFCNWLLIDTSSAYVIPGSSAIYTYNFALQGWQGRIDAVPDAAPHNVINPVGDGIMVYMTAASTYTWWS